MADVFVSRLCGIRKDSAKWNERPWKFTYKRSLIPFWNIVADNQRLANTPPKKKSHVVKFLETEFRLKGFAELFSKSDKGKKSIFGHFFFRKWVKTKVQILLVIKQVLSAVAADGSERQHSIAEEFQSFGHSLCLLIAPLAQNVVHLVSACEVAADTEADA